MFSRVTFSSILIVIACLVFAISKKVRVRHGPGGMSLSDTTNCSEFSKFGRFNPYSVINEKWFVFYYWAPIRPSSTYVFIAPTANHTKHLKRLLDGNCVLPVMWSARQIMMEDDNGYITLLVERDDRGAYWLYPVPTATAAERVQKITPRDVRLKQTGDNRILGLLDCVEDTLLAMAKINDVPRKGHLHEQASRLGYRSRKGRSYLYQGHEWGPIPEADESFFWEYKKPRKGSEDTSKEDKSTEGSSEEEESQEKSKSDQSKQKKSKVKRSKAVIPEINEDDEKCFVAKPELWNDPKPNPNPNNLITKEELNNQDIKNTLTIEVSDGLPNTTQESNLDNKSQNTQENDKLDRHQNALEIETKNLELHTDDPDLENENCEVCFQSKVSFINGKSYRPESTTSTTNLNNDEESPTEVLYAEIHAKVPHDEVPHDEVPHDEVPHDEVPHDEVPHDEVPHDELPHDEVPHDEVPHDEVPYGKVPHIKVPHNEVPHDEIPHDEVLYGKVPHSKVPHDEVPHAEVPHDEVPHDEVPHDEVPYGKVPHSKVPHVEVPYGKVPHSKVPHDEVPHDKVLHDGVPHAKVPHADVPRDKLPRVKTRSPPLVPTQDSDNATKIIILSPQSLDI